MAVQIGAQPDAGFDNPLGMLRDCHRRIENFLLVLCRIAERRHQGALSAQESAAAQSALAYFRTGGQRHTQDEEQSLFPRLQQRMTPADLRAIGELEQEHEESAGLHAAVDRLFSSWIASGSLSDDEHRHLLAATGRLQTLYAGHIRLEEEIVFPKAAALLDVETISAIGSEFRIRRGHPAP